MPTKQDQLALDIISRNASLKSDRAAWEGVWQDLADYIQPRKSQINTVKSPGTEGYSDDLYDRTAGRSNMVLASGQMNYVTPANERWFAFDAPAELKADDKQDESAKDDASRWFQQCTDIALRELARSNFYLEIHELYLDRGCFGTGGMFCEEGKRTALNFANHEVGSYSIAEDSEGVVDTIFREFDMTCRQAVQKFGVENVGKTIADCYNDKKAQGLDKKFPFIHAIYPREDGRKPGRKDGPNKPVASVYVNVTDKVVVRDAGFDEMPYFVSRFLKWGKAAYGYSPAIEALPTVRQVNFIEKQMDALAELAAFPRILIPDGLEGDVDLRSGGVTTFDPNIENSLPREWGTSGRYDIGQERVLSKQKAIEEDFHVPLFKMFAERDKQMTAREVIERVQEKLVLFSPTFARMTTELLNPLLQRVFSLLYRNGKFPEPPPSVLVPDGEGVSLAMPEVVYTSKIALAIKALQNQAFMQFVEIVAPLLAIDPSVLDVVDMDRALKDVAKNLSLPVEWIRPTEAIATIRQQRAEAQQAQAAAEQAKLLGGAAKDASQADPAKLQAMAG